MQTLFDCARRHFSFVALTFLVATCFTFLSPVVGEAQEGMNQPETPTAESILERFGEAFGGQMELASRTSYQFNCTVDWEKGPYEWIIKQQNEKRVTTQQEGLGRYRNDGKYRWRSIKFAEWQLCDPSTAWQSNQCYPHPVTVSRWLESPDRFTYEGESSVTNPATGEAFEVDRLKQQNELGAAIVYSFDKETGLLVHFHCTSDKTQTAEGIIDRSCFLRYAEVNEFLVFSETWSKYKETWLHITTDSVNWDSEFPEDTFRAVPEKLTSELAD